jgi:outer membrane receptor protein involved in Fe transport
MKKSIHLIILLLMASKAIAQNCEIVGKIVNKTTHDPIIYANVFLLSNKDSSLINGTITDDKGYFSIQKINTGNYHLQISFIGYQTMILNNILLQPGTRNLGETELQILSENLDEITVTTTKPAMIYKVDRKVIDAGSFPGADVAIDLLENIPSVQLDLDGNLTYRGDGTFKVYINGHPIANGVEKLRQLPTSRIDKIEIITNPSAKYDAEGTAGIIQVILKKNRLEGYAINSSLSASTLGSYRWLFDIDNKTDKSGWYINGYASHAISAKYDETTVQTITDGTNSYITYSDISHKVQLNNSNIEVGFNYDLTDKDYINFSGYIDPSKTKQKSTNKGWITEQMTDENNFTTDSTYYLNSLYNCDYQYVGGTLTYEHAFDKSRSHLLSAYLDYSGYVTDLFERQYDEQIYNTYTEREGFVTYEHNETMIEGKLNYQIPLSKKINLETGAEINTDHIPRITSESGSFDENKTITKYDSNPLNQTVDFIQDVYASYFSVKREAAKLSMQAGLRVEYTKRQSDYSYDNEDDSLIYVPNRNHFTDLFPSAHITYSFTETHQLYLSYSRRIERPSYWKLVPLIQYQTPYSYYTGNGDLLPSYTDAWDFGYKRSWDKNFISAELYTRKTNNVIQTFSQTSDGNMLIKSPENIGKSLNTGIELMSGIDIVSWWNCNISTCIYSYKLNVDFNDYQYTRKLKNGDVRWNNTFLLPKSATLKWDLEYISPYTNAQTTRDAYYVSNLALKKEFHDGKWIASMIYNDIFSSEEFDKTESGDNFSIKAYANCQPFFSFKLAYTLDNQK